MTVGTVMEPSQPRSTAAQSQIEANSQGAGNGVRTRDIKLGKLAYSSLPTKTYPPWFPNGSPNLAAEILQATAEGRSVTTVQCHLLALGVLEHPTVRLAMKVMAGGEHGLSAAIELAALLVDGDENARQVG